MIILPILFSADVYAASGQCLNDQQTLLLLRLKNSLVFDTAASKFNLVDWNQSMDCGTWDGVSCHEGRVIGLRLGGKSIVGGIDNSSLFNLRYLESLDLSFNDFSTPIPSSLGKLTNLRYLNLSNAGFVGQIPIEIAHLTNLVTLDFSTDPLVSINLLKLENPNLTMMFQNLSKLEELYLDGVNVSARGGDWCHALSSSLPNLRVLSMSNCYLSGPIDRSLEKLQSLSVIRLDLNSLFAPVPDFIANFSNLTSLSLVSCELHGTFPKEILQVPTLQTIDISNNILLEGSLPEFPADSSLRKLALGTTNFSGSLPTSISNLRNLSRLELSDCQFNGTLPNSMAYLTQLVYLDLSVNNFTGPIPSFRMSKNLTQLVLSHNSLTGAISLADWEGLLKLVHLDLHNNLLSGFILSSLFSALPSLEEIQLSYNQFTGQLPEFPDASFSKLRVLEFSSNNFEGSIPASIFKLRKLSLLSLAFNKLNSTLQVDMFQGLRSLNTLLLSYNNLSFNASGNHSTWSSFPKVSTLNLASCKLTTFPNLKNQSNLVYLDISDNQIHGQIPNWIWEIGYGFLLHLNLSHNYLVGIQEPYSLPGNLNALDLHSNQIHGKIPILPSFASYIDFSDNKFTSFIPTDIGNNLSVAIFFSLSNNRLTGIIPKSLCNATFLEVLDLSYNNLTGVIPRFLTERMDTLGVLNLRSNYFSGTTIPDTFPANCSLKTMDLNGNFIQGPVPKSLANCAALEVLDLGHNKITDDFPCFLKNISTLRVLVLRSNKFHGSIQCSDTDGTWEMLQIIDLAHNNFSGQLPARSLANWKAMTTTAEMANAEPNLNDHLQFQVLQVSQIYYQDSITLTSKGLESKLVKILTICTCIDFSSNSFNGPIPEEIGALTLLYVLNLSNNAFSGSIPSSFGELHHLESLDLSRNELKGDIPASLAGLNFLSYLNLSFNQLMGRIPSGSQFQTFSDNSFWGNEGLCGSPWAKDCADGGAEEATHSNYSTSETEVDWNFISAEVGFVVGFGTVVGPLVFCKRWRKSYFECADDVAFWVFPLAVTRKWLSWTTSR
ncbi:LRR domain containing protein [Trema orientale]|uniref:LRR domain containing protein n=1 Tax=Trema orientale TaxID=63057 RepID=A0A2P5F953_TREOI|nr:LRR domain containing protein [Trema orientale]